MARRAGGGDVRVVLERRAPTRPALGLHEDDAVGTAAAVDGGRRRVLQYRDRLDVVRVDRVERVAGQRGVDAVDHRAGDGRLVLERHTIDDVERVVARRDRRTATDADLDAAARLAVVGRHLQARDATLQELVRVGDDADVRVTPADGRDRSRDRLAPLRAVARDDQVAEHGGLRGEDEVGVDRLPRDDDDRLELRCEADAGRADLLGTGP